MLGAVTSFTVTVKLQLAVLFTASATVIITVVTPCEYVPLVFAPPALKLLLTVVALFTVAGAMVNIALQLALALAFTLAGHVTDGNPEQFTVTINEQVPTFAAASLAL